MTVGVICSCMPSFAKWARHMNSSSKRFHSLFSFLTLLTGRNTSKGSNSYENESNFKTETIGGSNKKRYGKSARGFVKAPDASDIEHDGFGDHTMGSCQSLESHEVKSTRGFITQEDEFNRAENGIRLKEFRQP